MPYQLIYREKALSALEELPKKIREQILGRLKALTTTPRPGNATTLQGVKYRDQPVLRLRSGDYRILYSPQPDDTISILDIGHRKEVYRGL